MLKPQVCFSMLFSEVTCQQLGGIAIELRMGCLTFVTESRSTRPAGVSGPRFHLAAQWWISPQTSGKSQRRKHPLETPACDWLASSCCCKCFLVAFWQVFSVPFSSDSGASRVVVLLAAHGCWRTLSQLPWYLPTEELRLFFWGGRGGKIWANWWWFSDFAS